MKTMPMLFLLIPLQSLAADVPDFISACFDCHGKNGVSSESDVPTIAGASSDFVSAVMQDYIDGNRPAVKTKYRSGDKARPETDMKIIAEKLTEDQRDKIGDYFSEQSFVRATQKFDPVLAAKGKKVHENRCEKCHADNGSSADDDAGILAGQWTPYLEESFKFYRSGERRMDKKMKKKFDKVSDKSLKALLNFYASPASK